MKKTKTLRGLINKLIRLEEEYGGDMGAFSVNQGEMDPLKFTEYWVDVDKKGNPKDGHFVSSRRSKGRKLYLGFE